MKRKIVKRKPSRVMKAVKKIGVLAQLKRSLARSFVARLF